MIIITIEGNIGCGKTTLIQELKKYNNDNIIFIEEPVDIWSTISIDNITILDKFYEDPIKYGFSFQMMAYISRLSVLNKTIKNNPDSIIVTERCLLTDKNIFAKMLYDSNKIDPYSYQIYNLWFTEFFSNLPKHKHIYLYSEPENIINRIKKRNRKGEEKLDINYLKKCHEYHELFLNKNKDLIKKINIDEYIDNEKKYNLLLQELIKIFNNKELDL
jgi:deoxyadenosine/deoxycytidine kinase